MASCNNGVAHSSEDSFLGGGRDCLLDHVIFTINMEKTFSLIFGTT